MSLIAIAIFDTPENRRSELTRRTLESLLDTVDFTRHRVFLSVNAATPGTMIAISNFGKAIGSALDVIHNEDNLGTARAINKAWKYRQPGENAIKMDNDVVIHQAGWVDILEECISREPRIGIIGLKRKDLDEGRENSPAQFASKLIRLHAPKGYRWLDVEVVQHVMGTCQMYSAALLDKIGYLYQPGLYGFDDSLAAARCQKAGFFSCFYPAIEIDHIDPPGVHDASYTKWKSSHVSVDHPDKIEYERLKDGYLRGAIPVYYDADGNQPPVDGAPAHSWTIPNLTR
jgi:GT2 family glycosyltransferase